MSTSTEKYMKEIQNITYEQIMKISREITAPKYDFLKVMKAFTEKDAVFSRQNEVVF